MAIKTVSLKTARLLKEAGFRQDSEYAWMWLEDETTDDLEDKHILLHLYEIEHMALDRVFYSAPTTDEILAELPKKILTYNLRIGCGESYNPFYVKFVDDEDVYIGHPMIENESLPEVLAAMYLWLKKEGLLKSRN